MRVEAPILALQTGTGRLQCSFADVLLFYVNPQALRVPSVRANATELRIISGILPIQVHQVFYGHYEPRLHCRCGMSSRISS